MTPKERQLFTLRLIWKETVDWPRAELIVVQPGKQFDLSGRELKELPSG